MAPRNVDFREVVAKLFNKFEELVPNDAPLLKTKRRIFRETIKLIQSDELRMWEWFPSYEECDLVSFDHYDVERERIADLREKHSASMNGHAGSFDRDD